MKTFQRTSPWLVAITGALGLVGFGCGAEGAEGELERVGTVASQLVTPYTLRITRPAAASLNQLAVIGEQVKLNDGVQVFNRLTGGPSSIASIGSGGVNVGVGGLVGGTSSLGPVELRNNAGARLFVATASTFAAQAGALLVGSLITSQPVEFQSSNYTVTWPATSSGAISLEPDQTLSRAPGRYDAVNVKSRATLVLSSGAYYFESLTVEPSATLRLENAAGPVRIFLRGPLLFRGVLTRRFDFANVLIASVGTAPITIEAPLRASVWAPGSAIVVSSSTQGFRGTLIGKNVEVHQHTPFIHEPYRAPGCVGDLCAFSGTDECAPGGTYFREYDVNVGQTAFAPTTWTPRATNILENTRDWVCTLSRVGGELDAVEAFDAGGDSFVMKTPGAFVRRSHDYWIVGAGRGVAASATCVHKTCFSGAAIHVSGPYSASAEAEDVFFDACDAGADSQLAGAADEATFLSGFNPWEPSGGGENGTVRQSSTGASTINASDGQCGDAGEDVLAEAHAFRGGPLNVPALFFGPDAARAKIESAGTFSLSSGNAQGAPHVNKVERLLAPTKDAYCYLSSIGGKFAGGGEFAKLDVVFNETTGQNFWRLYAQHMFAGAPDGVQAAANCYALNQDVCGAMPAAGTPQCQALTRQRFTWQQGQAPRRMGSASDRACFLTEVSGHFEGGGEAVRVRIQDGVWVLDGTSLQTGVRAVAQCVATPSMSPEFEWRQGEASVPLGPALGQACFLTRMTGKFKGGGERVETFVQNGQWFLGGGSGQESVAASARCIPVSNQAPPVAWSQGQPARPLNTAPPAPRTFCFLSRVAGHFQGGGESVGIQVVNGPNGALLQSLSGQSNQTGVAGSAVCAHLTVDPNVGVIETPPPVTRDCTITSGFGDANYFMQPDVCWLESVTGSSNSDSNVNRYSCRPHSCFQGPDPEDVVAVSPLISDLVGGDTCSDPLGRRKPLLRFDSVAHLTRFNGSEGRGEFATITQSLTYDSLSELATHSCMTGSHGTSSEAMALTLGRPDQQVKFMRGPQDAVGPLDLVGEFSVDSLTNGTVTMTPVATSQCVFAKIGGKFVAGGEFVRIDRVTVLGVERWQLRAQALSGGGVFATARCFPLIQNP